MITILNLGDQFASSACSWRFGGLLRCDRFDHDGLISRRPRRRWDRNGREAGRHGRCDHTSQRLIPLRRLLSLRWIILGIHIIF